MNALQGSQQTPQQGVAGTMGSAMNMGGVGRGQGGGGMGQGQMPQQVGHGMIT